MLYQRCGFEDAKEASDIIEKRLKRKGLDIDNVKDGIILGSGLGSFVEEHLDQDSVVIPFADIYKKLDIHFEESALAGHARSLVIGPLKGTSEKRLVIAQSGREHPYEGIPTKRAVFWLRIMQLLRARTLLGSNAAGVVTPKTLKVPALMLIFGDKSEVPDNPLIGPNEAEFGTRFPHMADHYPEDTRRLIRKVARKSHIPLAEGLYFRSMGPHYETREIIYGLRGLAEEKWRQAKKQPGEKDYKGKPVAVVGMSTVFENIAAQHAAIEPPAGEPDNPYPAFRDGRGWVSVSTNNAAGLGAKGIDPPPNHNEVQENARIVQDYFGRLMRETVLELRKAA